MRLSLVMPYYRNPRMLMRHLLNWRAEWSADMKRDVEIVIVDDGSPDETAADAMRALRGDNGVAYDQMPKISVYRVTEDRPWHQHGARNLGAHVARAPWLLMTDMDHIVPVSTLDEVLRRLPLSDHEVLTFGRVDAPPTLTWRAAEWPEFARTCRTDGSLKPHVNSFVVSRERYWQLGGYDEDYCGIYGTDIEFRRRLFGAGSVDSHLAHAPLIRVDREVIPDASTRDVQRKEGRTGHEKRDVAIAKAARGEAGVVKSLQFAWERVI